MGRGGSTRSLDDTYSSKTMAQKVKVEDMVVKNIYFVPHPTRLWVKVLVERVDLKKGRCHVRDVEENAELDLDPRSVPFLPVNPSTSEDMTSLYHLHEPGIIDNLEQRADLRDQRPYTRIANVLIAVNPLRRVPDPDRAAFAGAALGSAPPHPWGIAETAFRQMSLGISSVDAARTPNQSIVISGESGAGKTETCKVILAYLCTRAARGGGPVKVARRTSALGATERTGLDRQLLDSNPILEALGNAKTFRNDNSSRFGKFMKLQFARSKHGLEASCKLMGATIETYLLERSRVIEQTDGERNYHALYQVVVGSSAHDASQLVLPRKPEYFQYLNSSSCKSIDNVDDAKRFAETREAFQNIGLGLSDEDYTPDAGDPAALKKERQRKIIRYFEAITRVLAATLHLGNITFDAFETAEAGDRACIISKTDGAARPALNAAVATLGVDADRLEDLLIRHRIQAPNVQGHRQSYYTKEHDKQMAQLTRDAIAKEVYSRMFDAVVADLGASMTTRDPSVAGESLDYIGVLDIFGFESFARNDIEQLLINFANESLQATFNRAVLVAEQELYAAEGIGTDLDKVEVDNSTSACVSLIADKRSDSILRILDEFSKTAKAAGGDAKQAKSDSSQASEIEKRFCRDLHSKLKNRDRYVAPRKKDILDTFVVAHYASNVQYTVGRFIDKNANEIPNGLDELLADSEVFGSILTGGHSSPKVGDDDAMPNKDKKKKSLSAVFTSQMNDLCSLLDSTSCSFVRCIKPNTTMRMGVFERDFVAKQLRAQGILQTCDVLKLGMPTRIAFEEVETRYRKFAEATLAKTHKTKQAPLTGLDARGFTASVLWSLGIGSDAYSMGKTRVFFKTGKIALLDRLYSVDLESEEGTSFVKRLRYFQSRRLWRRALAKVRVALALKQMWERLIREYRAVCFVQVRYRYYRMYGRGKRRRINRRRWRVAYIKVRCLAAFSEEYSLIHETRLNRERLEREAAASMMEIKVAKRSASAILSEAVARGQISKDAGGATLEKMREHEQSKQKEDGVVSGQNPLAVGTADEVDEFEDLGDDAMITDDLAGESRPLSRHSSVGSHDGARASKARLTEKQEVETLLDDAAAAIANKPDVDQKVAAEVRKAMSRLKLAKATLKRWMKILLIRGWEKWRDVLKSPSIDSTDEATKQDDDSKSAKPVVDAGVADAWLKADIRRALNELRSVLAKAPRLKDGTDELNDAGLAKLLDPIHIKTLPEEDDEVWEQVFRPAGTGTKLAEAAAAAAAAPPPPPGNEATSRQSEPSGETDEESEAVSTLQQQIALLKKQLNAAGVQAVELIPLAQAREKMNAAVKRLMDGDMDAEKEVEKYDQIIRMHPDYEKEEAEKAEKWVRDTRPTNLAAQEEMRKLVPPDIRTASLADLEEKGLPQGLVRRLWTKKATWLVRFHPEDTAKLHIADLLSKYNNQGLDIVEMRAVWASLPEEFDNDGDGKKAQWKANFRTKLMELVTKEEQNRLSKNEKRNPGYKGINPDGYFNPNEPLVRAGITKSNPYAAQEKPVIKVAASTRGQFKDGKKAEKAKMSGDIEREGTVAGSDGKKRQLTKAKKFVVLINGELKAYNKESELSLDKPPEFVMPVRGLGDDKGGVKLVAEPANGLTVAKAADGVRLVLVTKDAKSAEDWRKKVAEELAFQDPKEKMKQLKEMKRKAEEEQRKKKEAEGGGGMSGGLMAAIANRGRGGGNAMLDGIKTRGRGGGRGTRGGGSPMMTAIQARGRGGGRDGGGRASGGLMDAIASRGRGGRAPSRGGQRGRGGSLMDAIAAKRKPAG